jgi:protein ImuB
MTRIVSVWLPDLPIERLRRAQRRVAQIAGSGSQSGSDKPPVTRFPFALVATGARGRTITAINRSAQAEGLHVGQRLADARAALPVLRTGLAAPERDQEALYNITTWAGRYGPSRNIEGSGDDGFWIDIAGVAHLFGGEAELLADMVERLRRLGFTARAAIADTPGAAFALCRYGLTASTNTIIAPPGTTRAALAPLTVAALRLDAATVQLLQRLGLRRIGQLYDISRPALAQRFRAQKSSMKRAAGQGSRLAEAVLTRLDQALGDIQEPLAPLVVSPPLIARRLFADPLITTAGVDDAAGQLAAEVCAALDNAAKGARQFVLRLYRADGSCAVIQARTSRPSRQAAHVLGLLAGKLPALDLGFGVDAVTLEAAELGDLGLEQGVMANGSLHAEADQVGRVAALVDRLSNRLGQSCVFALQPQPSHIPERAERRIPAMATLRPIGRPMGRPIPGAAEIDGRCPARPAFLLSPPEPVTVDEYGYRSSTPSSFVWRRLHHRVASSAGPERIAPEWWRDLGAFISGDGRDRTRDYYRVEDSHGGRYWLFREGPGTDGGWGSAEDNAGEENGAHSTRTVWYMHGFFG